VQLSLLDIELLLSADFRANESWGTTSATALSISTSGAPVLPSETGQATDTGSGANTYSIATVFAQSEDQGPCTTGFDNLGWLKDPELVALDSVSGFPIEKAFEAVSEKLHLDLGRWGRYAILKVASVARLFAQMNSIRLQLYSTIVGEYEDQNDANYNITGGESNRVISRR
jgi:hypothetical protein